MESYPQANWRVIYTPPSDGAMQMAIDEAIWQAVARGEVRSTLRLYGWDPPTLSLGRAQPAADISRPALRRAGYGLVRRPTGGRAILHRDELTYSVVIPLSDPRVRGDILASCQRLSQGLLAALDLLRVQGVQAERREAGGRREEAEPICFESVADFEIAVGGRKLIGSAQRRGQGTLLQHGSLPLQGDLADICAFLSVPTDPQRVRARATTLSRALNRQVSWHEAADAVTQGFARALNLRLEPGSLSPQEGEQVERLRVEKYGAEDWTLKL